MRISDWSSDVCSSDLVPETYSRSGRRYGSDRIISAPGRLPDVQIVGAYLPDLVGLQIIDEGPPPAKTLVSGLHIRHPGWQGVFRLPAGNGPLTAGDISAMPGDAQQIGRAHV